ncbi:MAG TPA: GxxExxY protein [Kofleriaceae bacterium]|nr:GxxExxY protein [Kofleriaceae bacterium]
MPDPRRTRSPQTRQIIDRHQGTRLDLQSECHRSIRAEREQTRASSELPCDRDSGATSRVGERRQAARSTELRNAKAQSPDYRKEAKPLSTQRIFGKRPSARVTGNLLAFIRADRESAQPKRAAAEVRRMQPIDPTFDDDLPRHLNQYAHDVIGAAIEVHRHLGPGYPERIYEQAMLIELADRGFNIRTQVTVPIQYKQQPIGTVHLDLLVEDELVLELKAIEGVTPVHKAQVLSYLKATRLQLGLVINFNVKLLKDGVHRVIMSRHWS